MEKKKDLVFEKDRKLILDFKFENDIPVQSNDKIEIGQISKDSEMITKYSFKCLSQRKGFEDS